MLFVLILNSLFIRFEYYARIESDAFPRLSDRPFPEDWSLRGFLWTTDLFPDIWFGSGSELSDDDEKLFELLSMVEYRRERVLWLGWKIASYGRWLKYDSTSKTFKATPEFSMKLDETYNADADTLTGDVNAMSRTTIVNEDTTSLDVSIKI